MMATLNRLFVCNWHTTLANKAKQYGLIVFKQKSHLSSLWLVGYIF